MELHPAQTFWDASVGTARWVVRDLTHPGWGSFCWWAAGLTLVLMLAQRVRPWARQPFMRQGFWVDQGFVVLNVFAFPILGWAGAQAVVGEAADALGVLRHPPIELVSAPSWPSSLGSGHTPNRSSI